MEHRKSASLLFHDSDRTGGDNPPVQGVEVKLLYSQRGWSMMDLRFRVFGFRVQGLGLEFRV